MPRRDRSIAERRTAPAAEVADEEPSEPRKKVSARGMWRALLTLAGVAVGLAVAIWVNAGSIEGLGDDPEPGLAAGMEFPVSAEWRALGSNKVRALQARQPRGTTITGVWCPPVRRARVPFPCEVEPGYLYVSLAELRHGASAEGLLKAYARGVGRRGTRVRIGTTDSRHSQDNTQYVQLEYRYMADGSEITGIAAVFTRPRASALVASEGPTAAFRAVRGSIDRFASQAVEAR